MILVKVDLSICSYVIDVPDSAIECGFHVKPIAKLDFSL